MIACELATAADREAIAALLDSERQPSAPIDRS